MVSKVASGSVEQTAWAGDSRAIRSLVKTTQELADYILDKQRMLLTATQAERREDHFKVYSYIDEERREAQWLKAEAEQQRELEAATRLVLEVRQRRWDLVTSGEPEEILDGIDDPSGVRSMELKLAGGYGSALGRYKLRVELGERGAHAYFGASEGGFIDMAGRRLTDQFRMQRPWYWWFRASWFVFVLFVPVAVVGFFVSDYLMDGGAEILTVILAQLLFQGIFIGGPYLLLRRLASPFELTLDGHRGKTSRRFSIFGSILAWVAASIVIPLALIFANPLPPEPVPSPSPSSTP